MKVLVATSQTQGTRVNDFSFVPENELVAVYGFECDSGIDGACGCMRSFSGITTHKATTTAKVVEWDISKRTLVALVRDGLTSAGWISGVDKSRDRDYLTYVVSQMLAIAESYDVGTVIEWRRHAAVRTTPEAVAS